MTCRVPGCTAVAGRPGTARGLCVRHYSRFRKNGLCQSWQRCERPAVSHIGLCERHLPEGIPA